LLHFDLERAGFQRTLDENFKPLDVDGLREEIDRAALHRFDGRFDVAVGGHHQNRRPVRERQRFVDDLEAGFPGHAQVGDDHIERLRVHEVERLVGIGRDRDVVVVDQRLLQTFPGMLLVVDDQDARDHGIRKERGPETGSMGKNGTVGR